MLTALPELWWVYILVGIGCGIFSATFGVGSGIVLIPILVMAFSLPQKSAQGVALSAMVPMALVGAIRYKLNPTIEVDFTLVGLVAVGGVVGALIGSHIAALAPGLNLRRLFGIIMLVAAAKMLTGAPAGKPKDGRIESEPVARATTSTGSETTEPKE